MNSTGTELEYPIAKTAPASDDRCGSPNLRQLLSSGEGVAITAPGRLPLSYEGLRRQVEKVGSALAAWGIGQNDRVAIVLPQGPEMAVAFLGVAANATSAPLNPNFRASEFDFYLADIQPKVLLTQAGYDSPAVAVARERGIPVVQLEAEAEAGIFSLTGDLKQQSACAAPARSDDVALVLYTSGTTGRPKRVPLTQANLCISARNIAAALSLSPGDRCLNVMPLFHIHGLIGAFLSSLSAGASIVCAPAFQSSAFFHWVAEFNPTWYSAVPTIHQAVLQEAILSAETARHTGFRFIRSCSSALPPRLMERLEEVFGIPVIEAYGMTEASHQIASNPLPPDQRKSGSVGIATGPEVAIMDEGGELLSQGNIGEVVLRGASVTSGYEENPAANQVNFTHGWFRTGDQGYLDSDSYLHLNGRLKEIINRGGEKISPREIDEVLMRHPAVSSAVTFPLPHATLGEDVAAAVILEKNRVAAADEIRRFVAEYLADFKVPRKILIVEKIPTGPTGKIERSSLAEKFAQFLTQDFAPPATPAQQELVKLWTELLNQQKIGIKDNFFDLGGDSLTASRLLARVEAVFHKPLPLSVMILAPTIEQLAQLIEKPGSAAVSASLVPINETGSKSPLYCVHGHDGNVLIFRDLARFLGPDQPFYGIQSRGLDGREVSYRSIEEMARDYVTEIIKCQQRGPYFLSGYCSGGPIALEMARQLKAQGEKVALLALIDSYGPGYPKPLPFATRVWREMAQHSRELLKLNFADLAPYVFSRALGRIKNATAAAQRKIWQLASAPRMVLGKSLAGTAQNVAGLNLMATQKYQHGVYSGSAVLFRAHDQPTGCYPDYEMGWNKVMAQGLEVIQVSCSHNSMLHDELFADQFRECLKAARTEESLK